MVRSSVVTMTMYRACLSLAIAGALVLVACDGGDRASSGATREAQTITFNRHVAPILFDRCAACHRPDGSAPFGLLTYAQVRRRAHQIREVTASRYMPPWLPEPGYGRFRGERRLSDEQIRIVGRWIDQGMAEGDPSDLPVAPRWTERWQLGAPDLVVKMPRPYTLAAEGPDVFRNFVIPVPIERKRYVRTIEFRPGNNKVVHHAEILVDAARWSRQMVSQDQEPGFDGMTSRAVWPDGHFLGWTPGKVPEMGPDDMAWTLKAEADLVVQLHLQASGKPEVVQAEIGLHFTRLPPRRRPVMIRLGSQVIDIPAGAADYVTEDSYVLPVDVEVLSVYPHAHYLGKDLRGHAKLPDGTTEWLVWIKDWDFNWQDSYRFFEPLFLPRGTTLHMRYTYDNSSANKRNPHHPPQRVRYGPQSSDEMGDLWIQAVPTSTGDLAALRRDYGARERRADIAAYEKLLRDDPAHYRLALGLADLYRRDGRPASAKAVLEELVKQVPDDAYAQHDLAMMEQSEGNLAGAIERYRRALELKPELPEGHYNLANAYRVQKRLDEAIDNYRRAIELQPAYAEAHNNLGIALRAVGRNEQAVAHYRQALAIDPDHARAHHNLALALRTAGQTERSIMHLREAVRIDPRYAKAHINLGMALLRRGDRAAAMGSFRRAIGLRPDWPSPYNELAWMLATDPLAAGHRAAAIGFAERAAELTHQRDPVVLDTLATAYASVGRFEDAVRTSSRGLELAKAAGQGSLATQIAARLDLFRHGQVYQEDSSVSRSNP